MAVLPAATACLAYSSVGVDVRACGVRSDWPLLRKSRQGIEGRCSPMTPAVLQHFRQSAGPSATAATITKTQYQHSGASGVSGQRQRQQQINKKHRQTTTNAAGDNAKATTRTDSTDNDNGQERKKYSNNPTKRHQRQNTKNPPKSNTTTPAAAAAAARTNERTKEGTTHHDSVRVTRRVRGHARRPHSLEQCEGVRPALRLGHAADARVVTVGVHASLLALGDAQGGQDPGEVSVGVGQGGTRHGRKTLPYREWKKQKSPSTIFCIKL